MTNNGRNLTGNSRRNLNALRIGNLQVLLNIEDSVNLSIRRQLYGYFNRQTGEISRKKTWTWLRKGNLKRETKSLLIAAKNNAIRTNYVKAQINKTRQNSKCRLFGEREETIKNIISKCNKLMQKEYKTRND